MHIPLHTRSGQPAVAGYTGLGNDLDGRYGIDASYSITDNIAAQIGVMSSSENENIGQLSYQLGLGAFQVNKDSTIVFSGWALYGRGKQTEQEFFGEIEQNYSKYGLQAEAGLVAKYVESFAGLRYILISAPNSERTSGERAQYIEPSIGVRAGWTNIKFEVQLTITKRTDVAVGSSSGLLSFGITGKL
jgi:hypothetical protein